MSINYPASLDNTTTLPTIVNDSTDLSGDIINSIRDALIAIETELGIAPKGTYATVKARLDAVGTGGSTVTWAGDLLGSSDSSQKVVSLNNGTVLVNTSGLLDWSTGKVPQLYQSQAAGTGTAVGNSFSITAQDGQAQTGSANNNAGGILRLQSGAAGVGGSGLAARAGELQFFAGANKIGGFSGNTSDTLYIGGQTSGVLNALATSYGVSAMQIGTDVAFSYTISQLKRSGTGTSYGSNIVLKAQDGQNQTGAIINNNGGSIVLQAGAGGTGGTGGTANSGTFQFVNGAGTTIASFGNTIGGGNGGVDFFTLGPNAASVGHLRILNGGQVNFRNSANNGNISALTTTVDKLVIGGSGTTVGPTSLDLAGQAMTLTIGDGTSGGANQIASFSSTASAWTYPSTTTSVSWSIASAAVTTGAGITLSSQSATGTNATAGSINIQTGTGTLNGSTGNLSAGAGIINIITGNATIAKLSGGTDDVIYLGGSGISGIGGGGFSGNQNLYSTAYTATSISFGYSTSPTISQVQRPANTAPFIGTTLSISAQPGGLATGAVNNAGGGELRLKGGLPGTGGTGTAATSGAVTLYSGNTWVASFANGSGDFIKLGGSTGLNLTPTTITMNGAALPLTTIKPPTGTGFAYVNSGVWQAATVSSVDLPTMTSGNLAGSRVVGLGGDLVDAGSGSYFVGNITGNPASSYTCQVDALLNLSNGNALSYLSDVGIITISCAASTLGNGSSFTISAPGGAPATGAANNFNGGALQLRSGNAGTGGSGTAGLPGAVSLQVGGTAVASFRMATTDFVRIGAFGTSNLGMAITPTSISWGSAQSNAAITQNVVSGTGSNTGQTLTIRAQAGQNQTGTNANNNGGGLILSSGDAGTGGSGTAGVAGTLALTAGTGGLIAFTVSGTTIAQLSKSVNDYIAIGATPATTGPIRIGNAVFVTARDASNSSNITLIGTDSSNNIVVGPPGSGTYTIIKSDQLRLTSSSGANTFIMNGAAGSAASFLYDYGVTGVTIAQNNQGNTVSNTVGAPFTIQAQGVLTGANNTGGAMNIVAGNGNATGTGKGGDVVVQSGTGATAGAVRILAGATTMATFNGTSSDVIRLGGITSATRASYFSTNITVGDTLAGFTIQQLNSTTLTTASDIGITAQSSTAASSSGGNLNLYAGNGAIQGGNIYISGGGGGAGTTGAVYLSSGNSQSRATFGGTSSDIIALGANASNLGIAITPASILWGSLQVTPVISQNVVSGAGANSGQSFTIRAQDGQAQTGANANNNGGSLLFQSGAAGTGGSGAAGTPGGIQMSVGATAVGRFTRASSDFISLGANAATSGPIRIANSAVITARNGANTANLSLLSTDSNDNIFVGPTTSSANSGIVLKTNTLNVSDINNSSAMIMTGMSVGNSMSMAFDYGLASVTIQQNQYLPTLTNATGAAFTIKAQTLSSGTGNTGGSLNLVGGNASTNGGDVVLQLGTGATQNGSVKLVNAITTTTAPSAGAAAALPATPAGYVTIYINGTARQLPYY